MSDWIASCYEADTGVDGSGVPISATSITANLTRGAAAGQTILLAVMGGGGKTVTSVVDSGGNTWTRDMQQVDSTVMTIEIWRSNLTVGLGTSSTITITFSATNAYHQALGDLYTGTLTPDVTATCTPATSTAPTTAASATTTQSVETVYAVLGVGGGNTRPTLSGTSPFTVRQTHGQYNTGANTGRDIYSMDHDTTTTGTQTAAGTLSGGGGPWCIDLVAYKQSGGGSGGAAQTLSVGEATPSGNAGGGSTISASMIGFGLRGSGPDVSGAMTSYPWARCVSALDFWSNIEPTDGAISLAGFTPSFQHAIDNNQLTGIRIECARDGAPSWIYSANSIGVVQSITTYQGGSSTSPMKTPVPWDPNLRLMGQRMMRAVQSYLNTTYNGKTFRSVCAHVAVSFPTALEGTEMTIGNEGSSLNAAAWNALGTQTWRQQQYGQAWINCTIDALQAISGVTISMANGTVWGDGRAQSNLWCDYMAANLSASQLARVMTGPTDMRVDQPGAVSYQAWSADADTAMMHALSKGIRTWAQSAGWSWWGQAFNGGTLAAIETAYYTDAVQKYQCEMMESNTQILGNVSGLPTWCQNTLQPAILAQQWSITTPGVGGGAQAYGASVAYGGTNTAQAIQAGIADDPARPVVYGPSLGGGTQIIYAGTA